MLSIFNGWSAHDIVGPMNKQEVRASLLEYGIEKSCFRTWDAIERMVLESSDEIKAVLYQSGEAKKRVEEQQRIIAVKRRREAQIMSRNVRRRLVNGEENRDFSKFMVVPSAEEERQCYESFYEATSNKALHLETCPVCARERLASEGERTWILSDPSVVEVLTVKNEDEKKGKMSILRELLQIEEGGVGCWMCNDCVRSLEQGTLPKLSLANNLWIGDVPYQLSVLTIPEQLLIARHYPRCYIFKLFPRDYDSHLPLDQLYAGMAGNASLFEINTQEVVEMLNGQWMPSPVATLSSIIAITFVGNSRRLPSDWLKKTFRVRRNVVYDALIWLRNNNPIYADIQIDMKRLQELPDDDVPEEVLSIVRHEDDDEIIEKERESYLSVEMEDQCSEGENGGENMRDETEFDDDGSGPGHVIPIQYIGVQDCEQAKMTTNEILLYALANADDDRYGHEGGYAVIHGAQPIPDLPGASKSFDALAAAYPVLWPYGRGLYHDDRSRKIGFQEYIRWTLQYHDKRFRTHHSFPFVAFSIQQKQSALLSARIHMRRADFEADSDLLAELNLRDLQEAQVDEEKHRPIQNERVQRLRHHLFATSSHIMASGKMRASYRSQIWGTCLWLRPPSLWLTINPIDYEDPIAQVLAGENIDMDCFMDVIGPDASKRGRNMAKDPFASAAFFNFIVRTTLETLFGIHASKRQVESRMGILGHVNGYFGVVEAQGRGSLHVHMLLWLKHAPNADEMLELLTQPLFREKVTRYIDYNIRTHLDGFDEEYVQHNDRQPHISFSRPPNPYESNWKEDVNVMERKLARAHQVHVCKTSTCLRRNQQGVLVCKRRAPWPLVERTIVHATGVLDLRRTYQFLNGYSPALLVCLRCNNDIKVVIYGKDTKNLGRYLTNYQNKDPSKSYNMSALLGSALMYHQKHLPQMESVRERNRLLIYRCFNVLNRQAELSGPQVMSYLMNWGDHFTSHQYVPVYWGQLAGALKQVYPSLGSEENLETIEPTHNVIQLGNNRIEGNEHEMVTIIGNAEGEIQVRRQVEDYALRGLEFEGMGFLTFVVETYERRLGKETKNTEDDEDEITHTRNLSTRYLSNHPKATSHCRIARADNHNFLPNIVGSWFPRRDGDESTKTYYFAAMLALLKPWRDLRQLKEEGVSWESAFTGYMQNAPQRDKDVVAGCQYYYETKTIAVNNDLEEERDNGAIEINDDQMRVDDDLSDENMEVSTSSISDEDVARYEKIHRQDKEYIHGQLAVEAARIRGIFPEDKNSWQVNEETHIKYATEDTDAMLQIWQQQMQQSPLFSNDSMSEEDPMLKDMQHVVDARVEPLSNLLEPLKQNEGEKLLTMDEEAKHMTATFTSDVNSLNNDQRRAYDIVDWHLKETVSGKVPPQLLMMIPGEGGVGKSKLIQIMTQNFGQHNVREWMVKGAYTGIAASLIDGKTLHVLAGIPVRGGKQSAQTIKRLREFWRNKRYLIIDEISMLSRSFFAKLNQIISNVMEVESEKIFGGLNVILVGDFHQFPPVVARRSAPLYWPADSRHDTEDDVLGRKLFEQFTTIVQLNQQIRVRDNIWQDVLQHVRHGNCRQQHIDSIRRLIITNPNCPPTNYNAPPWKDAKLVTPRHGVRTLWNSAAVKKHCSENRQRLYICPAEDTIDGRPVTNDEKIAIITGGKGSQTQMDRAGLAKEIELAVGAPVMVTLNIHTDMDVANGVRGKIEAIILDGRERVTTTDKTQSIRLKYPPRYILVRLDRTKAPLLQDLAQNVIPIIPVTKTFSMTKNGQKLTVNRTQLPLTLAYAFTDYRSQGQTLEPVIVDIGPPPHGYLTPFNIYVALSRGTGRDNIRLLRDFDSTLLEQHPCEFLRVEDERLKILNETTKEIWETRFRRV